MSKELKSVSMMLLLLSLSAGNVYAGTGGNPVSVSGVQQNGSCVGVVKDSAGETVIGASVVVKGTTNGTITGIDGDFSLSNVKKGDVIVVSFVGFTTKEVVWNGQSLNVVLV